MSSAVRNPSASRACQTALALALSLAACGGRAVPWVPAGPPAHVTVLPPRDDAHYALVARDAAGGVSQCTLPCELRMSSGTAQLTVTGSTGYDFSFAHVLLPQPARLQLHERNRGRGIAGIALTAAGSSIIGTSFLARDARGDFTTTSGVLSLSGCVLAVVGAVLSLTAGTDGVTETFAGSP